MHNFPVGWGNRIVLYVGAGLLLTSSLSWAEDTPKVVRLPSNLSASLQDEVQFLEEETVVTAMRYEQPISEAPSNIYVITAEDIRRSGATDLPTILRRVPGMEVMQTTGADFNVSVRGDNQLHANKLLVLIDGRSVFLDVQGLVKWKLLPVTLPEIQRIEVLLGPASAVYGFNAFDGVVNIRTRTPEESQGTLLQVGGGEFGTLTSTAFHAGQYEDLGYRVSAGWDQNQRWRDRDSLSFRAHRVNLLTTYRIDTQSILKFSGGLVDSNREESPSIRIGRTTATPHYGYVSLKFERGQSFLQAGWNQYGNTAQVVSSPSLRGLLRVVDAQQRSNDKLTNNSYNVLGQHSLEFLSSQVTAGVHYRHNTLSSRFAPGFHRENRLGFYVQDEWPIFARLRLIGGVRYDLSSEISPTVSPRGALLIPFGMHTLRLSYSEAYRPPTLLESNLRNQNLLTIPTPGGPVTTAFATQGSKNVKPEHIRSIEMAFQSWWWQHRIRTRASLFYNELHDLIDFQPTGPVPGNPVVTANVGDAEIYGGEIGMEILATSWLSGWVNVAYQEIDQNITGETRRAGPAWKVNGGLRVDAPYGLSGEILVHYVDSAAYPIAQSFTDLAPFGVVAPPARADNYTLVNLRAGYRFWDDRAELALSVFNALNDRHREYQLGDTIKSRVLGWLTVKLG